METENNPNPEQPICQCGDDMNRFCSACTPWRREKVLTRAAKYRKPERNYIKEIPPVKRNKLDKKRWHQAKLLLQKALGKRLTNAQFQAYLDVRSEKLRKQREEIATYGPEGKPQEVEAKDAPASLKIDTAIKKALEK